MYGTAVFKYLPEIWMLSEGVLQILRRHEKQDRGAGPSDDIKKGE